MMSAKMRTQQQWRDAGYELKFLTPQPTEKNGCGEWLYSQSSVVPWADMYGDSGETVADDILSSVGI